MAADAAADPAAALLAPLASLPGVGAATARLLERVAGGPRVLDLLFHLPESYVDRSGRTSLREAGRPAERGVATVAITVVRHEPPANSRQPWRVVVQDETGFGEVAFFSAARLARMPVGARLLVSGRAERYGDRLQMSHPDIIVPADRPELLPAFDPVWPLTAGLFPSQIRSALRAALPLAEGLPEWQDAALLRRERWPGFHAALQALHLPSAPPSPECRARVAYDELLAHQLAMAWMRARERTRPGRALAGDGRLRSVALARFGHPPTEAQVAALAEIDADLAAPRRMLRLLQGDVGSGKTLVAMLAILRCVEAGAQAAMMAPTEVLAKQHHRVLSRLCPVPVGLLTGAVKGVARRNTLLALQAGRLSVVVGTHALFQEAVTYRDLGLAVIDEQHRFGVDQRMMLGAKGSRGGKLTDILVMTATPIPRTLLLTQWGEMEVSRLAGKPAGRQPIRTTLHSLTLLPDIIDGIARALDRGEQVFWVCPMVAESMVTDLAAAEARFAALRSLLPGQAPLIGLAHGQQETATRDAALAAFAAGRTRLLVATTVIEVGVDVPAASVMVVEHAERFGLAQLHQLRGRVGRGSAASYCLLLHEDGLTELARRRLTLLRDTEDGFQIADEDFRIRGGGDLIGKRQSGLPGYRLADPVQHEGLLQTARTEASYVLERFPALREGRGPALRLLLRLFERGEGLRALAAG